MAQRIAIGKIGQELSSSDDRVRIGIVLKHDVSGEARDEHGRWTSGGSSSVQDWQSSVSYKDMGGERMTAAHDLIDRAVKMPELTGEQTKAFAAYKGSAYRDINRELRDGRAAGKVSYTKELDTALKASRTTEELTVFRGMRGGISLSTMQPGDTFIDRGYVSTSPLAAVARQFTSDGFSTAICEIRIPEGSSAANVLGFFHGEPEVLLPRGSAFQIESITPASESARDNPESLEHYDHIVMTVVDASTVKTASMSAGSRRVDRFGWNDGDIIIVPRR